MTRHITSLYYDNIDPRMVKKQAEALNALGYSINQVKNTNKPHQIWIIESLDALPEGHSLLILDIDCIPLSRSIVEEAFEAAESGKLFGATQSANDIDENYIYAGPMFLALSKATWNKMDFWNCPNLDRYDVAGPITAMAKALNIEVVLKYPNYCLLPLWVMQKKYPFGIGTFYAGEIFHLFRSRKNSGYQFAFDRVCDAVIAGKPVDFIALDKEMRSLKLKLAMAKLRLIRNFNRYILRKSK